MVPVIDLMEAVFWGVWMDSLGINVIKVHVLWNHSSSWNPMFVGKQIFAGSWGRYFVGNLYDVTREDNSYTRTCLQITKGLLYEPVLINKKNDSNCVVLIIICVKVSNYRYYNHLVYMSNRYFRANYLRFEFLN